MNKSLAAVLMLLSFNLLAESDPLSTAIKACRIVDNDIARLQCFDAISLGGEQTKAQVASKAVTKTTTVVTTTKTEPVGSRFGLKKVHQEPESIEATIAKIKKGAYGQQTIYLADGQVWKQTDSKNFKLKQGDKVKINIAMFGSYLLEKEGVNKKIRVKRIK